MKDAVETKADARLEEEKQRAREQWSEDPCGATYASERELGTREFFEEVERHRYRSMRRGCPL